MSANYHAKEQAFRAFTLIELLVVVAIISLLISITLPSLAKARGQAEKVVCMNHQRQLAIAHDYYARENGGKLPHWDRWLWEGAAVAAGDPTAPHIPEAGQLFGGKIFVGSKAGRAIGKNYAVVTEIYKCPSDKGERRNPVIAPLLPANFSYSRNKYAMDAMTMAGLWTGSDYFPLDQAKRPAETPLLVEEHETSALNDGYSWPINSASGSGAEQDFLSMRHANKAVLSFHDMHADAVRSLEFNTSGVWSDRQHRLLAPGVPKPVVK